MAEYTNNHDQAEIEELPEGINVDGIGDILPEGGDDVKVPLMENGEPYPAHIVPEDLEAHNPDYSDTGTDDNDDSYEDWDVEADWNDDDEEDEEGSSDRDDEAAAESDSPRGRFLEFAGNTAALFDSMVSSVLSNKNLQELSFGVTSGDIGAYFSIKLRR